MDGRRYMSGMIINNNIGGDKMVDVLFIHPGGQKDIYQDLSNNLTAIAPPAWTALLADYVRREGYSVAIYDCNVSGWDDYLTTPSILDIYNPKLVVIWVYGHHPSASTQTMPIAGQIVKDIKKVNQNMRIAMGGIHPSALPKRTLEEEDIDYIIQKEGTSGILALINDIKYFGDNLGNKKIYGGYVNEIDSVKCFKNYAWDLLSSLDNYRAHNFHCFQYFKDSKKEDFSDVRSPYAAIYTSLGCPYNCFYCCSNFLHRGKIKNWSLDTILKWIDELVIKYKVKNIRVHDTLFTNDPLKLRAFGTEIKKREYNLNLSVYSRLDSISPNVLTDMKNAGVKWIGIGIESTLDSKNKEAKEKIGMVKDSGIYICGNYMFGLPNDTEQSMEDTLDLALDLNTEFANFYSTFAYPGSTLYDITLRENPSALPFHWNQYSQHGFETFPLANSNLSSGEILSFRDRAFHSYFSNGSYLNGVKKKFGEAVVNHINDITKIKLERRILTY
jgi:anaerobic magnesium-protoporphyrin IX monomethyl ester cyclase